MRRHLPALAAIVCWLVACGLGARAQTANDKVFRLGLLNPNAASLQLDRSVILPELKRLGFSEGRNLVVDARVGEANELPRLALDLVAARPDAIFAVGGASVRAAHKATRTVPIVMFTGSDPVRAGWAATLARPGGNVTGLAILVSELEGKRLHLLHEAVPGISRIATLVHPSLSNRAVIREQMSAVAAATGAEVMGFDAAGPEEYDRAFAAMLEKRAQALVISANPQFSHDGAELAARAMQAGLPSSCEWVEMAQLGCLIGYGPSRIELRRRAADYIARIFQGAAPEDLPIEQPTTFRLAINLRTARALGIELPPALLARADEVIE